MIENRNVSTDGQMVFLFACLLGALCCGLGAVPLAFSGVDPLNAAISVSILPLLCLFVVVLFSAAANSLRFALSAIAGGVIGGAASFTILFYSALWLRRLFLLMVELSK